MCIVDNLDHYHVKCTNVKTLILALAGDEALKSLSNNYKLETGGSLRVGSVG